MKLNAGMHSYPEMSDNPEISVRSVNQLYQRLAVPPQATTFRN